MKTYVPSPDNRKFTNFEKLLPILWGNSIRQSTGELLGSQKPADLIPMFDMHFTDWQVPQYVLVQHPESHIENLIVTHQVTNCKPKYGTCGANPMGNHL
eukprot:3230298-Ditylum_brightwellii.AAC.1